MVPPDTSQATTPSTLLCGAVHEGETGAEASLATPGQADARPRTELDIRRFEPLFGKSADQRGRAGSGEGVPAKGRVKGSAVVEPEVAQRHAANEDAPCRRQD